MKGFLLGFAAGGAAAYLLDPEHGAERRQRVRSWWLRNEGSVKDAGRTTVETIRRAQPMAEQAAQAGKQAAGQVGAGVGSARQKVSSKVADVTGRGAAEEEAAGFDSPSGGHPGPAPAG